MTLAAMHSEKKAFRTSLVLAVLLHLLVIIILAITYSPKIIEIPFKALNIKIGNPNAAPSSAAHIETPQVQLPPVQAVEEVKPSKIVKALESQIAKKKTPPSSANSSKAKGPEVMPIVPKAVRPEDHIPASMRAEYKAIPVPARTEDIEYTNRNIADERAMGALLGNRKKAEKDVVTNYTEVLGLWMDKHQSYPLAAQDRHMEGDGIIRLHIDKYGNILSFELIKSTGEQVLDAAIINMVETANPAPPIPEQEQARWFDLPVIFRLTNSGL